MSKTQWFSNVTLGSDPELFVINGDGEARPSKQYVELLSKQYSHTPLGNRLKRNRATYDRVIWDNIAAEFQPRAASCTQHHIDYLRDMMLDFFFMLRDPNARKSYDLSTMPVMPLPNVKLGAEVMEFGCAPSLSFTPEGSKVSVPNVRPENCEYRCVGGHIHIGVPRGMNFDPKRAQKEVSPAWLKKATLNIQEEFDALRLTGLCDIFLGTVGCLMEYRMGRFEEAKIRRELIGYGKAGEYRIPKHGFEYRTMSPWWMEHPVLMHMVLNLARDCYHAWTTKEIADPLLEMFPRDEVIEAINKCDVKKCEEILIKALRWVHEWAGKQTLRNDVGRDGDLDSIILNFKDRRDNANLVLAMALMKPDSHEHWIMREVEEKPEATWLYYHDFRSTEKKMEYTQKMERWRLEVYNARYGRYGERGPEPPRPVELETANGYHPMVSEQKYDLHRRWMFASHRWGWKNWSHDLVKAAGLNNKAMDIFMKEDTPITSRWEA